MAILPHYLSILPNLLISELHGTLSRHVFEETAERSLIFKPQNIGYLFGTFTAVQQQAFRFRFHPFMSFFYAKEAPEYKNFKNPEGALVPENRAWHEANNTYTFSYGLGALIMSIGILVFLGIFFPKVGLVGDSLAIIMTLGTLSFLVTTPEVWVPNLGSGEFGFPLLSGAGRLVIKDIVILAGAVVLLSDSSQRVLKTLKKD